MWLVAGAGAFALARLVRSARPAWLLEAVVALVAAAAAGLAATALDFGGWKEPDWRAAAFCFAVAAGAIGGERLIRLLWR
jgi:hypothetical protein